jgi:hypothetical protein
MQFLDGDAPTPAAPIDSEPKAHDFIIVLKESATKAQTDLVIQKAAIETDVRTKLDAFIKSSRGAPAIPTLAAL